MELAEAGVLEKYGVELIGAKIDAIKKAEDRLLFKDAMRKIGLETPHSQLVNSRQRRPGVRRTHRLPVHSARQLHAWAAPAAASRTTRKSSSRFWSAAWRSVPVHEVLIEESALGWKEYELEVMRDLADNCIIICSIENFDPMGVHTGDSITVAPAQTLTDREYQMMRDGALRCLREIGVDTGGSNVQFAINPANGRMVIIEMNPRVSRSSALASKATGFPIAKIAAKLAVGYRLDEIRNDITLQDAGLLRADHRLRRGQDSEVGIREIPRRGHHARHADEIRRRGDGHRAHLQGGAVEGHSQPRNRQGLRQREVRQEPDRRRS